MIYAARSEKGRRAQNQDSLFIPQGGEISLAVIADGMGGHSAGDIASLLAVRTVVTELKRGGAGGPAALIRNAVSKANTAVYNRALEDRALRGMGTTMVLAMLFNNRYIVANVGDSRLYHIGSGSIRQVTVDHSYVQELVAMGAITADEAKHHAMRNIITRALGTTPSENIDIFENQWSWGDTLLLCSDGLYSVLGEDELLAMMSDERGGEGESGDRLQRICDDLVSEALALGSTDNVSAILVRNEEAVRP